MDETLHNPEGKGPFNSESTNAKWYWRAEEVLQKNVSEKFHIVLRESVEIFLLFRLLETPLNSYPPISDSWNSPKGRWVFTEQRKNYTFCLFFCVSACLGSDSQYFSLRLCRAPIPTEANPVLTALFICFSNTDPSAPLPKKQTHSKEPVSDSFMRLKPWLRHSPHVALHYMLGWRRDIFYAAATIAKQNKTKQNPLLPMAAYLSHVGEQQRKQPGSHSRPCWRQTPSAWASCCPWKPGPPAWTSHRSVRASARWHGHCTHPHSRSGTGCRSPGRWSGMTGPPPFPQGPWGGGGGLKVNST